MTSQSNEKKPVLLIVTLPPANCIPTAMAIQAHMPDNVLILRTRFSNQEESKNPIHEIRLKSWLKGSDELISTFDDLSEPFPIPITRPRGYESSGNSTKARWSSCNVDDILSIIEGECERWDGEVRFDILPGAKNPLIPTLLAASSLPYSLWYTLEDGRAANMDSVGESELLIHGKILSIVDRAWLSGYPIHVEEERSESPDPDSLEFFRQMGSNLKPEHPSEGGRKRGSKLFDLPMTIVPEEFTIAMERLGYEAMKKSKDIDFQRSGEYLSLSKGQISEEFQIGHSYPNSGSPGHWLEPIVHSLLWEHWKPVSTTQGVSLFEPTSELRLRRFESMWEKGFNAFREGKVGKAAKVFLYECERLSLPKDCEFADFIQHLINSYKSSDKITVGFNVFYTRITEIDTIILDRFGVSSFDSKVKIGFNSGIKLELNKSIQLVKWITAGQYLVISSTHPSLDRIQYPNTVHLQRMVAGRASLLDEEMGLPWPAPDFLAESKKIDWQHGKPQSLQFLGIECQFLPSSSITFLDDDSKPTHGAIICLNSEDLWMIRSAIRNGYIPKQVLTLGMFDTTDIGRSLAGVRKRTGLRIFTQRMGKISAVLSTVRISNGEEESNATHNIPLDSLRRLIEHPKLRGHLSSTDRRVIYIDSKEELPGLDPIAYLIENKLLRDKKLL